LIGFGLTIRGDQTSWPDFVQTTITAAALVTVISALILEFYVRSLRRTAPAVLGFVLLSLVTIPVVSVTALGLMQRVPHGRWVRIPDPPDAVVGFVGPVCLRLGGEGVGTVILATASGGYFVHNPGAAADDYWRHETRIPEAILEQAEDCRPPSFVPAAPSVSGVVLDAFRIDDVGADCGGTRYYVVKDDLSVWEWSTFSCSIGVFGILMLYFGLIVLHGVIVGVLRLSEGPPRRWSRTPPGATEPSAV
jgi:hypothetical protein